MVDIISGFVDKAIELSMDEIIRHIQIALGCREELRALDVLVKMIMPFNLAIRQYGMALKSGRQISHPRNSQLPVPDVVNDWLNKLNEYLETARDLVEQCTIPTYNMIVRYQLSKRIRRVIADIEEHLKHTAMIAITNQFGQIERLKSIKEGQARIEEGIKGIAATIEDRVAAVSSSSSSMAASVASTGSSNPPQRLSSFQKPRYIAGPDDLFGQLQNLLIDVKESNPSRIGVVGMGGVGKTLLLRRLEQYCKGVPDKFEKNLVLWLTISQNPSILTLRGEIEKQLSGQNKREKRYVLFLDDVWEGSGDRLLEDLCVPETNCSKIIVSTREKRVLLKLGVKRENTFSMKGLDEDDSWRLFCSHAFPYNDSIAPVGLEEIAKKVCRECDGLPLAIKVIGAAMAGTPEQSEWELALHRLRSSGKIDAGTQEQLYDRLKLSYDALGAYDVLHQDEGRSLRLCFIYLGAFKEDQEIHVEALIKLWMGEGLLGTRNEDDYDPPAIGRMHVNLLLDRCLIEARREDYCTGQVIRVSVHDVLHDLARQIAESQENCFFRAGKDLEVFPAGERSIINSTRISLMDNRLSSFLKTFRGTAVRALLLSGNANLKYMPVRVIESLTSVRVLDLSRCGFLQSLPESLGCMKRLIYLNLSCTDIERVPASITRLKRLQLLDLSYCNRLTELPAGLDKLTSLWYLNARHCRHLKNVPSRLSMLTSLRHLNTLGETKNLWIERQESGCMARRSEEEREASGLKNALHPLIHLKHLEFSYGGETITEGTLGCMLHMRSLLMDLRHAKALPDDMSSMSQLRSLTMHCRSLVKIPSWVCDFLYLDYLELILCSNLEELPALQKLGRLRWLIVHGCHKLKELPGEFGKKGAFPALESFRLYDMKGLKELPALKEGAMPSLKTLELLDCFNVKELPVGVSRLTSLREIRVFNCPMVEEKMKEGGEQWEMIRSLQKDHHRQLTVTRPISIRWK